jgi:hypothetical protein
MKKIYFSLLFLFFVSSISLAQEQDTSWKSGGFVSLNFSQVSLNNWAAGGENSISAIGLANLFINYQTLKASWENSLNLGYGLLKSGNNPVKKFEDKIDFLSKYGHVAKGKLFYAGLLNFKSQFQPGYEYYPNDSTVLLSRFFSPAILLLSVGLDWKPTDYFSFYFSPATGKITFVNDQQLADQGAFGVDPLTVDPVTLEVTRGKKIRSEFGAYVSTKFKKDIFKNVNLETKLDLFENYTDKVASNKKNIDVDWTVLLSMKINKFLVASISTELIYDDNIPVPLYSKDINGDKIQDGTGPRTQFKEVLAVGFSYKF